MNSLELYLVTVLSILCGRYFVNGESIRYKEKYITVPLDHFSYTTDKTFQMRYLINDTFTRGNGDSPILFYCGNEASIELFAKEVGFIWELAPKINALIVFAEHRYYGKSLPFGNNSMNGREHFGYLTIEQTLADFSTLLEYLNKDASKNRPTIAIGGSYGGILAALLRMKYPHLIAGALAASAPLKQFSNMTACDEYAKPITKAFTTAYNRHCSSNIKKSWTIFSDIAFGNNGVPFFNEVFNFCDPWQSAASVNGLLDQMDEIYWHMAMTNYPYEADVYTFLPANPIKKFCSYLDVDYTGKELVKAFRRALDVYTNPNGVKKCFKFPKRMVMQDNELKAWGFQRCSELITAMCDRPESSMFRPGGENFEEAIDSCRAGYGIRVDQDVNRINNHFGLSTLKTATKIIFSNGLLDPWSAASILEAPNDETLVLNIPEGAHHIDLRYSNEMDPPSVVRARALEELYLKKWIREFRRKSSYLM